MIPLSVPYMAGNEVAYVTEAVREGWVSTAGSYVTQFERDIQSYSKAEAVTAVQSGTAALHTALLVAGVGIGDEVLVPTLTFIAAVNPIRYCGAEPVFMDCDQYLTIDCDKVEDFLKRECTVTADGVMNKSSRRRIKAIMAVHVLGNMADMERLSQLADRYGLFLIEDATEALGTYYQQGNLQGCFAGAIGDMGAYSFNGNKIITTGGGGMLLCKDRAKANNASYLTTQAKDDVLYYVHNQIGYNYRMTNIQAALGVAQLEHLESFISLKEGHFKEYHKVFGEIEGISLLEGPPKARNNHWLHAIQLTHEAWDRKEWIGQLRESGIECRPLWKLIHTQRMYQHNQTYHIEKAYGYVDKTINIPSSVSLGQEEIAYIGKMIKDLAVKK